MSNASDPLSPSIANVSELRSVREARGPIVPYRAALERDDRLEGVVDGDLAAGPLRHERRHPPATPAISPTR